MTDTVSKKKRSEIMSKIRSKNTKPELAVRSILHKNGLRFRIHRRDLPGTPDVVLPALRTIINVNGCFWHQHRGCDKARMPKTRVGFWRDKFRLNDLRLRRARRALKKLGWRVVEVWECETADLVRLENKIMHKVARGC